MGRRLENALESGDLPEIASSIIFEGKDLNFFDKDKVVINSLSLYNLIHTSGL